MRVITAILLLIVFINSSLCQSKGENRRGTLKISSKRSEDEKAALTESRGFPIDLMQANNLSASSFVRSETIIISTYLRRNLYRIRPKFRKKNVYPPLGTWWVRHFNAVDQYYKVIIADSIFNRANKSFYLVINDKQTNTILSTCSYISGNRNGAYHQYYTDGNVEIEGKYETYLVEDGLVKIAEKETKVGSWKFYLRSGIVEQTKSFKVPEIEQHALKARRKRRGT